MVILSPHSCRRGELWLSMRGMGVEFGAYGEWKTFVAAMLGNSIGSAEDKYNGC